MKRTYEKPQMAVHLIRPMTMIAASDYIPLDSMQSEDEEITMPGGAILLGNAL